MAEEKIMRKNWEEQAMVDIERIEAVRALACFMAPYEKFNAIGIDLEFIRPISARVDESTCWNELWDGWDVDGAEYKEATDGRTVVCHGIIVGNHGGDGGDIELRVSNKYGEFGNVWASEVDLL